MSSSRITTRGASLMGVVAILLLLSGFVPLVGTAASGFSRQRVANIKLPTAVGVAPNGDVYAARKDGILYRISEGKPVGGTGRPPVALKLKKQVCSDFERGLLGIAFDPNFGKSRYIYLYYTMPKSGSCENAVNRVSRFKVRGNGSVRKGSEKVLLNNIPSPRGNHNAGDLQFGGDGYLYVSVGDGGEDLETDETAEDNTNATKLNLLNGKILRITKMGGVPNGNPYTASNSVRCNKSGQAADGKRCQEIWAYGLRNPFRIAFNSNGSKLYINDVGQKTWEEIDQGVKGANYGWNTCEGKYLTGSSDQPCTVNGAESPLFAYKHNGTLKSITGGAFVPVSANWTRKFNGGYIFADFSGGMYLLKNGASNMSRKVFTAEKPVHLVFGGNALYYSDIGKGAIFRIFPEK